MLMYNNAITATKANSLYWVGRYAERVYISLHLLRRYYDHMIDGDLVDYTEYYKKLDVTSEYTSNESFRVGHIYDENNPSSLMTSLELANDNAIVLREEIKSESLSYIQMSLSLLKSCAERHESNITELQPVTDYMLSFFGSIYERVFDKRIRSIIKIGKLVENIDMHVRFNYPCDRILEAFESLKFCQDVVQEAFDKEVLATLNTLLAPASYNIGDEAYKNTVLNYLNRLVLL